MPSQTDVDLDAALSQAQAAVNTLAEGVSALESSPPPSLQDSTSATAIAEMPRNRPTIPRATDSGRLPPHLRRIMNLRVPVIVRVAQKPILLSAVLKLVPGNILEFDRSVNSELDLMVNNHQIGTGAAVKVNEHFGLRINSIGDPRDRLQQMT